MAGPALMVAGAPWPVLLLYGWADRLAVARGRHPERLRTVAAGAPALACVVAWRTPAAVDALRSDRWLLALEVASLIVFGASFWLECIGSPPLVPRGPRPHHIATCAAGLWTAWIMAYLLAMSNGAWYTAYPHPAGRGFSLAADQQVAAGIIWATATCCFVPVIFWNLLQWLRGEEDPDHELTRLVREEHRRFR